MTTDTGTGVMVTSVDADLVVSAWLVAVTVTVAGFGTDEGAVSCPVALIVPLLVDQVTEESNLPAPLTKATQLEVFPV